MFSYYPLALALARLGARGAELQPQAAAAPPQPPPGPRLQSIQPVVSAVSAPICKAMDDFGFSLLPEVRGCYLLHLVLGARLGLGLERLVRVRG